MMVQETTVSLRRVSWILNVSCMYYAGRQAETKRFARIPSGVKGLKDVFNLSAFCSLYIYLSALQWLPLSFPWENCSFDRYNRYSHNPKSRVRPHSCQPSTKGGSSKNLKHSLCLELCHSDMYHEDPCRTCFLPQVNLSRQPYQLWETPSSLLALRRAKDHVFHLG